MNPNHLLLLISFLIMCQSNEALPSLTRKNNCSDFVSMPLDFINVENFRSNVKQELKLFNCTYPGVVTITEADLENPSKGSLAISSDNFCTSINSVTSWKPLNSSIFPVLNHLERKIFTNRTLCLVVCTKDLNETLWPYCGAIRNLLGPIAEKMPSEVIIGPAQPEAGNNVTNQSAKVEKNLKKNPANPSGEKFPTNDLIHSPDLLKKQKDDPPDLDNSIKSQKGDLGDQSSLEIETDQVEVEKKKEVNPGEVEGPPVEVKPNGALSKMENMPHSNKKTAQLDMINANNQIGEHPLVPANGPSKSLAQTAIVAGAADLRPENDESHYFIYFVVISMLCIFCYIGIYNKKKILALMIEGRKQKDRRRHASAGYRKLNTNLEEVMPLGTSAPATDSMIY